MHKHNNKRQSHSLFQKFDLFLLNQLYKPTNRITVALNSKTHFASVEMRLVILTLKEASDS